MTTDNHDGHVMADLIERFMALTELFLKSDLQWCKDYIALDSGCSSDTQPFRKAVLAELDRQIATRENDFTPFKTRPPTVAAAPDAGKAFITDPYAYPLWELMHNEHGLTLLETELQDIMAVCKKIEPADEAGEGEHDVEHIRKWCGHHDCGDSIDGCPPLCCYTNHPEVCANDGCFILHNMPKPERPPLDLQAVCDAFRSCHLELGLLALQIGSRRGSSVMNAYDKASPVLKAIQAGLDGAQEGG